MNILFFTYDFPYPTNSGGKTRAYNLLKFAKKDSNITLFSFTRSNFSAADKKGLNEIGIDDIELFPRRQIVDLRNFQSFLTNHSIFHSLYFDESIQMKVIEVVKQKKIDLFHAESFYTGFYISQVVRDLGVKQVYGTENIEHSLYEDFGKQSSSLIKRKFFLHQAKKIRREEEAFYQLTDSNLAVTGEEAEYIKNISKKPCFVVENGVDLSAFSRRDTRRPKNTLVFIGNFSYFPNTDAMTLFMEQIFPLLPSDIEVVVVGKKSSQASILRYPRVRTVEYVENIQEAYEMGTVFIAPVRLGGGTNFKILEAMAAGIPVVALSQRVKELGLTDGKEILIADTPEEFAKKVSELLFDLELQKKLIKNAKIIVHEKFAWKSIGEKLHKIWEKTIHEKS